MSNAQQPQASQTEELDQEPFLCTTCAVTALVWDEKEETSVKKPVLHKLARADQKWLWTKKRITVGFYESKERGMKSITDFDKLVNRMLPMMQNWTASSQAVAAAKKANPKNTDKLGAGLEIVETVARKAEQVLGPNGPDIRVEVRNNPNANRVYKSNFGIISIDDKTKPSMTLDLGHFTDSELAQGGVSAGFFSARVHHEFGHALGFVHEHLRSDFQKANFPKKDKDEELKKRLIAAFPELDWPQIQNNVFNIPPKPEQLVTITNLTKETDEESVMMYPFDALLQTIVKGNTTFTKPKPEDPKNTQVSVITGTTAGKRTKFNTRLSFNDLIGAAVAYP